MNQLRLFGFFFGCLLLISCSFSLATASDSNFAQWSGVFLQGKFDQKWGYFLETQTRLNDSSNETSPLAFNQTRANRLLIRPAIRYLPWCDGRLQFHLGYGWTPNLSPNRNENRIWQQVLRQEDGQKWWWATRLRLEQRWIENSVGTAWRARGMVRLHRYLSEDRSIGISVWDEWFQNLNSVSSGPVGGFDQNRFFVGPNFIVAPGARVELGYMNVYLDRGRTSNALNSHVYALYVFLDF